MADQVFHLGVITKVQLDLIEVILAQQGIKVHTLHPVYIEDFYVCGDESVIEAAKKAVRDTDHLPEVKQAEDELAKAIDEIFA